MAETATPDTPNNSLAGKAMRAKRTVLPPPAAPSVPDATEIQTAVELHELPVGFVRKPFGSHVQKLKYPERPGFHRHWFNDTPGRIARALEAGYKHVQDREGRNVARIVGVAEQGGGLNAYLMEIPLQYYLDDQRAKDAGRDELDAKLKRGIIAGSTPGKDGAYLPTNQAGTVGPDIKVNGR